MNHCSHLFPSSSWLSWFGCELHAVSSCRTSPMAAQSSAGSMTKKPVAADAGAARAASLGVRFQPGSNRPKPKPQPLIVIPLLSWVSCCWILIVTVLQYQSTNQSCKPTQPNQPTTPARTTSTQNYRSTQDKTTAQAGKGKHKAQHATLLTFRSSCGNHFKSLGP